MKKFTMRRDKKNYAEGVILSNGKCVVSLLDGLSSVVIHDSLEDMEKTHYYKASTILFIDNSAELKLEKEINDLMFKNDDLTDYVNSLEKEYINLKSKYEELKKINETNNGFSIK